MDSFLKSWFSGFDASLSEIDQACRNKILKECGKACSDSYTKQVYIDAKRNTQNDEEFFAALKKTFCELEIDVKEKGRCYEIIYRYCACDLVKQNLVHTPYLCECSRSSLRYNLESVWGEGQVDVNLVESILTGAPCCRLQVIRK
jgi:hypothetical protein